MSEGKIVAMGVEKVQDYIYQRLTDMTMQSLNDAQTLRSIIGASQSVEQDILKRIEQCFQLTVEAGKGEPEEAFLWTSGKVIFIKKDSSEEELREQGNKLFVEIYKAYDGKINLVYTVFDDCGTMLENIKEATKGLKNPLMKSRIIGDNVQLLFRFNEENQEDQKTKESQEQEQFFARDLNKLVIRETKVDKSNIEDSSRNKIAIIKADINNMGQIFQGIDDEERYKKVSQTLKEYISVDSFRKHLEDYANGKLKGKVLPFYIAGDDLFLAVRVGAVLETIIALKKMIQKLNQVLGFDMTKDSENKRQNHLTLAVGVTFVDNHQPIRYYYGEVEAEMADAKWCMKKETTTAKLGVSIAGSKYYFYYGEKGKGEKDGFNRLAVEIKEITQLLKAEVITQSFLYNLLLNLGAEPDVERQMLLFLYLIRPEIKKSRKQVSIENGKKPFNELEIYFRHYLVEQLLVKKDGEKRYQLCPAKINQELIPKLRLWLMLTDERYFEKTSQVESKRKYIIKTWTKVSFGKVKATLFNKPLTYLENRDTKTGVQSIVDCFIKSEEVKETKTKRVYKKVAVHSSSFYRAKRLTERMKDKGQLISQLTKLFENAVLQTRNKESQYKKEFDAVEFSDLLKSILEKQEGNNKLEMTVHQAMDQLIVFYHYSEMKIRYLCQYKPDK